MALITLAHIGMQFSTSNINSICSTSNIWRICNSMIRTTSSMPCTTNYITNRIDHTSPAAGQGLSTHCHQCLEDGNEPKRLAASIVLANTETHLQGPSDKRQKFPV